MEQVKSPEYLTIRQACELLQVHPNTLRSWDKKGVLKAHRIGVRGIRRYKREDLIKFMEKK
ncbi:helix-turn-helix domain-containing protein [Candidatus Saccharibacteria bacterium]|nr:helix-turn-helix domain-containing protein [Candidatus Saccharibacteria bacterium]